MVVVRRKRTSGDSPVTNPPDSLPLTPRMPIHAVTFSRSSRAMEPPPFMDDGLAGLLGGMTTTIFKKHTA